MALTVSVGSDWELGKSSPQPREAGFHIVLADVTFDASYAAAGETIAASDLGYTTLIGMVAIASTHEEYFYSYDSANSKIAVADYDSDVVASTDLSGVTTKFLCFGI